MAGSRGHRRVLAAALPPPPPASPGVGRAGSRAAHRRWPSRLSAARWTSAPELSPPRDCLSRRLAGGPLRAAGGGGTRVIRCRLTGRWWRSLRTGALARSGAVAVGRSEQRLAALGVEQVQVLGVEPQLGLFPLANAARRLEPGHDLLAVPLCRKVCGSGVTGELFEFRSSDPLGLDHEVGVELGPH